VILTAAHCVTTFEKQQLSPDLFRVVLGGSSSKYSLLQNSGREQIFDVRYPFKLST
jgi:NADPH-dependent ferric siderophore reductase